MVERIYPESIEPSTIEGQVLKTVGGEAVWEDEAGGGGTSEPSLFPLTTEIGGEPQLMWDENNNLMFTTPGTTSPGDIPYLTVELFGGDPSTSDYDYEMDGGSVDPDYELFGE